MLAIIGGSGLYKMEKLERTECLKIETPFGPPSSEITVGIFGNSRIAFLPRHGSQHQLLPSEINYRANIWALKSVGVTRLLSVSAVGSLREEIRPGELVMPNQYFDWTKGFRNSTFFGKGLVAHVSTAEPTCIELTEETERSSRSVDIKMHFNKTYGCVEGPRLGTRAESFFLRQVNCDVVGMTNVPEVFLAREAQICYATIGVVTDYDCWMEDSSQHASVDKVLELYRNNIGRVQTLLRKVIETQVDRPLKCSCRKSLQNAVMTEEDSLSHENVQKLLTLRN